jgi:LysR family transcriptional activator of glutamate synthase operon
MKEDICLAVPVDNPLSKYRSIALSKASEESFICLYKGKGLRKVTDEYCRMTGFTPNIILESDSPSTVRDLITVGLGVAFIPKISWSGMGRHPAVVLVEISGPRCTRYINMSWERRRYESKASKLLQNYLIDFFKNVSLTYSER